MKICGNCGREMVDAAKFCPGCGAAQTAENSFIESSAPVESQTDSSTNTGLRLPLPAIPVLQNKKALIAIAVLLVYLYLTDFSLIVKLTGNADSYIKSGNVYMESWDYENAVSEFNKAIIADENYARAYARRGEAYVAMRRYEEAKRDIDTALALDRKCVEAYLGQNALIRREDEEMNDDKRNRIHDNNEKIKEFCNDGLSANPNDAALYLIRAEITPWSDDNKRSIMSDCDRAIELAPDTAKAYAVRAQQLARDKKNYDRAIEDVQKALSLNPGCARAYNVLGNIYQSQDEVDQRIDTYTKAVEMVKSPASFHSKLAQCYIQKREPEKADENYSRAIALAPQDSSLYFARASFYESNGEYDKAIADYKEIPKMYPKKKYVQDSIESVNKSRERNFVIDKIRSGKLDDKLEGLWVSNSISHIAHKTKSSPDRWEGKSLSGMPYDFFSSDYAIECVMIVKKDNHYILEFVTDRFSGINSKGDDYQKQIEKKLNHSDGGWWRSSIKQITADSDGNTLSVNSADMGTKMFDGKNQIMTVSLTLTYNDENKMLDFTNLEERRGGKALSQGTTNFQYQFTKSHKYKKYGWKEYITMKDGIWKKGLEKLKSGKNLNE